MPQISILIPIYNSQAYLEKCLESIIAQTFKDIEIVCINDGSTDSSLEIIQKYASKDERVKIIDKENSGYGHSLNIGIEQSNGRYIGIVESDDFIAPEMYEDLYNLIEKNNCDVVKSDWYNYWDKTNSAVKRNDISKLPQKVLNILECPKFFTIQPTIWSCLFRKDFLIKKQIKFLESPGASYQDTSFNFKVFAAAQRVMFTDKAYYYYMQDNVNSSVKNKQKIYSICDECAEIARYLKANPDLDKNFMSEKLILQYKLYMWNLERIDESFRPNFVERFADEFRNFYNEGKLGKEFFKNAKKYKTGGFLLLINNEEKFLEKFESSLKKKSFKDIRRKIKSYFHSKSKLLSRQL